MAKISALTEIVDPIGTETVVVVSGGVTRRASIGKLAAAAVAPAVATATEAAARALSAADLMSSTDVPGYAAVLQAPDGTTLMGIDPDGAMHVDRFAGRLVGTAPTASIITRRHQKPAAWRPSLHVISVLGQSWNQNGKLGGRFNVQPKSNLIAYPFHAVAPTGTYPLVSDSQVVCGVDQNGGTTIQREGPAHGATYINEYAVGLDGLDPQATLTTFLVTNNATGGTTMAQNARDAVASKPSSNGNHENTIAQAQRAFSVTSPSLGLPVTIRGNTCAIGNGGTGNYGGFDNSEAGFRGALKLWAKSLDMDTRSVTGRPAGEPTLLFTRQINTPTLKGDGVPFAADTFPIARAIANAHTDAGSLVRVTSPDYIAQRWADKLHFCTRDAVRLGAYDFLAYVREIIEGTPWQPLQLAVDSVMGSRVIFRAIGAEGPLAIDTTDSWLPAQDDAAQGMKAGFTCRAGDGSINAVTAVQACGNYIVVDHASAVAGMQSRYAINRAVNRGAFEGGCGNVRDSMGDLIPKFFGNGVDHRLHKALLANLWSL